MRYTNQSPWLGNVVLFANGLRKGWPPFVVKGNVGWECTKRSCHAELHSHFPVTTNDTYLFPRSRGRMPPCLVRLPCFPVAQNKSELRSFGRHTGWTDRD